MYNVPMAYLFEKHLREYKTIWYDLQPSFGGEFHPNEGQIINDKDLVSIKKDFARMLKQNPGGMLSIDKNENHELLKSRVLKFMTQTLGLSRSTCDILDDEGYYDATLDFVKKAKAMDESISNSDLTQAMRNAWVVFALQIYMGESVKLTNAIFAYSMLYPLTDNYMDNPTIDKVEKQSFNKRFYKKISAGFAESYNEDEAMIFHMIDLIESDYCRNDYPDVYKSLLAILDAQNKSLDQQNPSTFHEIDLLAYTFYKGGSSVLADAYLVKGSLSEAEAHFAYGYGVAYR